MKTGEESRLQAVPIGWVTSVPFFLVTQLKNQILRLARIGMQITVFTAPGPELDQMPWADSLRHVRVDIHRRPAPWCDLRALVKLTRLFRHQRLQIVHSTTPKAGLLTAVAGWLARVPVRLHTFTGQQWVTMSGPLRWISRWSDRVIGRLNTRVYADSPSQRQFLIDQGIVQSAKIGVIGAGSLAGVDTMRFNRDRFSEIRRADLRRKLGIGSEAVVITFIGRIARDKGVYELLQAMRSLRAEGLLCDLLLIGPVDSALEGGRGSISSTIGEQLKLLPNVHAIGYTDTPEHYFAITDVLCLPSYREGFGTVVIEAAAMGLPTVGTRITGLSDAVVNDVTGLLVPPRDVAALAAALRRLVVDPVLRQRMGQAAHQRCLEQFDADMVNRKLAEEYARLLSVARSVGRHDNR